MKKIITTILIITLILSINVIDVNAASGGWKQSNGGWWYDNGDGTYASNEYIDGYWIGSDGWYDPAWNGSWKHNSTGWWFQSGSWYPTSQWLKIDGSWYYFKSNGYMASNEWVGNYYLKSSGAMAVNEWIGDYYVGSDGAWVPGKKKETANNNTNTNTNTNQNTNTNNNSNTNNNTTNNNTNNNQNNDTTTITHIHNWVTTYKTYEPNFTSKFVATPVDGYKNNIVSRSNEILTHGWNQKNYIECNECHTQYNTYADYKTNDKCAYHTYTNPTVERDSNGTVKYIYENGILVYNSNDISIVTIKENYIITGNGAIYYSLNEKDAAGDLSRWGACYEQSASKPEYYGPEVLSVSTVCSGCGDTK